MQETIVMITKEKTKDPIPECQKSKVASPKLTSAMPNKPTLNEFINIAMIMEMIPILTRLKQDFKGQDIINTPMH